MRVVHIPAGSSEAVFQAKTFGIPSQETFQYLNQISNQFQSSILPEARMHFQEVEKFHRVITFDDAIQALKGLERSMDSFSLGNRIRPLSTLEEIQNAPDIMIPWIMANPTIREKYQNNELEGYGERFVDLYDDLLGDTTMLYQVAVNGIRREVGEDDWQMEIFPEVKTDLHMQIDMDEQISVIDTWYSSDLLVATGDRDPTSPFNNSL